MNQCIFCDIVNGKIKSISLYEDELIQVIMDIDPISEGHVLILPKAHKLDLDELSEQEAMRIMQISRLMVKILKEKFQCQGYTIMQNGGCFNDIGHYHMHVFQRNKDDGFAWQFLDIEHQDVAMVGAALKMRIEKAVQEEAWL